MEITFEQLTHQNFSAARALDRDDIPESFVDTAATIMEITDYGYENNLIGHTYLILCDGRYAGLILLGVEKLVLEIVHVIEQTPV